ncbi:MAG: EamA family transporter [archaeon]|nr:MAG: EamA family transporter [archaeon]
MKKYVFPVAASFCLATIGIFTKLIGDSVSPFTTSFYRVFIGMLFLFPFLFLERKRNLIKKSHLRPLLVLGILLSVIFISFLSALQYAPVTNVVLIFYTYPLFVYFLSHVFLKERIAIAFSFSIILALAGIFLINYPFDIGPYTIGNILAIVSAMVYGSFVAYLRYQEKFERSSVYPIFWSMLFAAIILSPVPFLAGFGDFSGRTIFWVLGIGILSTGLGYGLSSVSLKFTEAHKFSTINTVFEPLVAVVLAVLILSESPGLMTLAGGALLILSGLVVYSEIRKEFS